MQIPSKAPAPAPPAIKYTPINENPFIKAEGGDAVSTFSIDVDTASYSNVRQFLLADEPAAAARCRADRRTRQLLPLRLRTATPALPGVRLTRPVRRPRRSRRLPLERRASPGAHRA